MTKPPTSYRNLTALLFLAVASAMGWAACGGNQGDDEGGGGDQGGSGGAALPAGSGGAAAGGGQGGGSGGPAAGAGGASGEGLPCDVQSFLQANCTSCHGHPLSGGAPMPLSNRAEAIVTKDGGATYAALSLARIKDGSMPPGTPLAAAQYKAFEDWVDAGTPAGSCGPGNDPLSAAPTCTSGKSVARCDQGDRLIEGAGCDLEERMNPGMACISCHQMGEGPGFSIAGTAFATGHEPDLCAGGPTKGGGAQVVITDAGGAVFTLDVNASGNFWLPDAGSAVAFPIRAKVVYEGRERVMQAAQASGDCNTCHSQSGSDDAPGRVVLP